MVADVFLGIVPDFLPEAGGFLVTPTVFLPLFAACLERAELVAVFGLGAAVSELATGWLASLADLLGGMVQSRTCGYGKTRKVKRGEQSIQIAAEERLTRWCRYKLTLTLWKRKGLIEVCSP